MGELSWTHVPEQLVAAPAWDPAPLLGHRVGWLLPPLLVIKGGDADERSGLEGVPLCKEHAG